MRVGCPALGFALLMSIACAAPAVAAEAPSFVIPGRSDVPVIVNPLGYDASYTVVEGDFGLDRPGQVNPVIVGPRVRPMPYYHGSYFPGDGRRPGYGRLEVEPRHRVAPKPAESYHRFWGTASDPIPATLDPPAAYPIEGVVVDGRNRRDRDLDRDLDRDRNLDRDGDQGRDRDDRKFRRRDRPRHGQHRPRHH
jgi:hypothetical protein